MRFLLRTALVVVALGAAGYVYLAGTAGEFKTIELVEQDTCVRIEGVPGAEDLVLDRLSGQALISSDDRAAELLGRERTGGIYSWATKSPGPPRLLTADDPDLRPHGVSLVESAQHGHSLLVVDHRLDSSDQVAHSIRRYSWDGSRLVFVESYADEQYLISPNDVAGLSDGTFYFTNDHGSRGGIERAMEDYLRIGGGSVVYFNGSEFEVVADGVKYANGIAVDEEMQLVYVASTTTGKILVFDRDQTSGALTPREEIETDTGVDNIDLDPYGNLWVAAHPKLLTFVRHAGDPERRSPSEVLWIAKESATDPRVRPIWRTLGEEISGSSVAVSAGGSFIVGSVFEPHAVICERAF